MRMRNRNNIRPSGASFTGRSFFFRRFFPVLFVSRTFFLYFFPRTFFSYYFFRIFSRTFFLVLISRKKSHLLFPVFFPPFFSRTFSKVAPFEIERFKISVCCFSSTYRYNTVHVPCEISIQTSPVGLPMDGWGARMRDLKGPKMN